MADVATIEELETMKQGSPKDPGPIAPGLQGWKRGDALAVCSVCIGRIMNRGFGPWFTKWTPVWSLDSFPGCDLPSCKQ